MAGVEEVQGEVRKNGAKPVMANRNGKKAESSSGGGSFFTWFIVLALLGVWTSVAVVYFDLVDYQGVLDKAKGIQINLSEALQGKLVAYDTDGDGDFDVEDAKILLGLASASSGQSPALDWLEEVEEEGSDWLNAFFTFLYGLISPPDRAEEGEEEGLAEGSRRRTERARHDGKQGQKVVIVGLQNQ
uniref:Aspartyl beta-hydroxylase/Triadin domain-containing protein n=1 Tax=Periophthalmus magnuspinnatus TaxID=409849 RepID=A0A3B3ZNQ2_9GOBI